MTKARNECVRAHDERSAPPLPTIPPNSAPQMIEAAALALTFALSAQGFVAPSPRAAGHGGLDVRVGDGCRGGARLSR